LKVKSNEGIEGIRILNYLDIRLNSKRFYLHQSSVLLLLSNKPSPNWDSVGQGLKDPSEWACTGDHEICFNYDDQYCDIQMGINDVLITLDRIFYPKKQ
jgi:hypothetical protein